MPFCIDSGGQADLADGVLLGLDFLESFLEIIFGVFPFERLGDLVVEGLKLKYGRFKAFKVWEVVWRQDLALQHGEEYLNLVEPTGVVLGYGSVWRSDTIRKAVEPRIRLDERNHYP